jgi:hypothetical protein
VNLVYMRGVFNLGKYLKFRHLKWLILGLVVIGIAVWNLYGVREGMSPDGECNPDTDSDFKYVNGRLTNDDFINAYDANPGETLAAYIGKGITKEQWCTLKKDNNTELDNIITYVNVIMATLATQSSNIDADILFRTCGSNIECRRKAEDQSETGCGKPSTGLAGTASTTYDPDCMTKLSAEYEGKKGNDYSNNQVEEETRIAKISYDKEFGADDAGKISNAYANMTDAEKQKSIDQYKQWEKEQNGEQDANGKDKSNANQGEEVGDKEPMTTMLQPWQFR